MIKVNIDSCFFLLEGPNKEIYIYILFYIYINTYILYIIYIYTYYIASISKQKYSILFDCLFFGEEKIWWLPSPQFRATKQALDPQGFCLVANASAKLQIFGWQFFLPGE